VYGKVLASSQNQTMAKISGPRVVWMQGNLNSYTAIYMKNLETGYVGKVYSSSYNQAYPDISGTRVVWMQEINKKLDFQTYTRKTMHRDM
jgi:hypothetical protein